MAPLPIRNLSGAANMPICAWCPSFDPHDPANAGTSHTICPSCQARLEAECDAAEAERQIMARVDSRPSRFRRSIDVVFEAVENIGHTVSQFRRALLK